MIGCGDSDMVIYIQSGGPQIVAYFSRMLPLSGGSGKSEAPPHIVETARELLESRIAGIVARRAEASVPGGDDAESAWSVTFPRGRRSRGR